MTNSFHADTQPFLASKDAQPSKYPYDFTATQEALDHYFAAKRDFLALTEDSTPAYHCDCLVALQQAEKRVQAEFQLDLVNRDHSRLLIDYKSPTISFIGKAVRYRDVGTSSTNLSLPRFAPGCRPSRHVALTSAILIALMVGVVLLLGCETKGEKPAPAEQTGQIQVRASMCTCP